VEFSRSFLKDLGPEYFRENKGQSFKIFLLEEVLWKPPMLVSTLGVFCVGGAQPGGREKGGTKQEVGGKKQHRGAHNGGGEINRGI